MTTYPRTDPTGKPWPAFIGKKDFAQRVLTRSPSYVTNLSDAGRLIMHPNGKWVDVYASLDRIEATASPDKAPVAERHAAARTQAEPQHQAGDNEPAAPPRRPDAVAVAGNNYQQARAVEKRFQALEAKRAYEVAMGQLRDAREVEHAVATAFTATRTALQNTALTLAPVMAATTTEEAARQELAEAFESILAELQATLSAMSSPATAHQAHHA